MNLYHYCSNQTLIAILSGSNIRTSDLTLSNDTMEGKWVRKIVEDTCKKYDLLPGKRDDFYARVDSMCNTVAALGFCLSTEGDMLSQWRGYAEGGAGISIGFRKAYLEKLCASKPNSVLLALKEVEYDVEKQLAAIKTEIDAITPDYLKALAPHNPFAKKSETAEQIQKDAQLALGIGMLKFVPHLFTMKNPAFSEERESRIISLVIRANFEIDDMRVQYRGYADRIVPFEDIPMNALDVSPITEIILGPRNITPESVVRGLLLKTKFKDVAIKRSTASFR